MTVWFLPFSQLALDKSKKAEIKDFAQMMINDHTQSSNNLKAAAKEDGVNVPTEMTSAHAAKVGALGDLSGDTFDRKYMQMQVEAHQEALALMKGYAASGDSKALKQHAEKTAPVIQTHLEHAEKLNKGM